MEKVDLPQGLVRFGVFEVNFRAEELRKSGVKIKLRGQPFQVLKMLLERPGEIVTREEIQNRLWPDGTFVDFDHGLNLGINRIREVLDDSATTPRFVETIPRRGYRFIAPVGSAATGSNEMGQASTEQPTAVPDSNSATSLPEPQGIAPVRRWQPLVVVGAVAVVIAALGLAWFAQRRRPPRVELKQWQLTNSSENAVTSGRISPDGKYLAYVDRTGIHLKLVETADTRTIPQPEALEGSEVDWWVGSWFPDGTRFLAVADLAGQRPSVWTVAVVGGAPRKLRDDAFAWSVSPDGTLVALTTNPGRLGDREIWLMGPNGEQPRKLCQAGEKSGFGNVRWSPDSQRVVYIKSQEAPDASKVSIENRDLKGGPPITVLSTVRSESNLLFDLYWLPDGRMIYSLSEPESKWYTCNLWQMRINTATGKVEGQPSRLTHWAGFCMDSIGATADGQRLSVRRLVYQDSMYLADLDANGTRITTPRRLVLSEANDVPWAWTADSRAVLFYSMRSGNGHAGIFKQALDADAAEPLVTGTEDAGFPVLSPDGAWVLYLAGRTICDSFSAPTRLMRVPVTGGSPELVLTFHFSLVFSASPRCAISPATLCAIAERTPDGKQLIFTAFDPIKGRDRELTRLDVDPEVAYAWDLSPDGSRIAVHKRGEGRLLVLSLRGHAPQEVVLKGWSGGTGGSQWAADGKGWYVTGVTQRGLALMHVDLKGDTHVLWERHGASIIRGVPSPDGRHLAILDETVNGDIWMIAIQDRR